MKFGRSDHLKGLALTGLGVVILSPDAMLVRLISADPMGLLFWRGLLMSVAFGVYLAIRERGRCLSLFTNMNRHDLLTALLFAGGTIAFVISVKHTFVANTLIILSITPLLAALLSILFLREHIERSGWIAVVGVFIGTGIIFSGSTGEVLWGDAAALAAAFIMAGQFVVLRAARMTCIAPMMTMSGIIIAGAVWPFAPSLSIPPDDFIWMGLLGLIVLPAAFSLIFLGPKYLKAPEVGLVMLLEMVLGPIWALLALGEVPGKTTLWGGALILCFLGGHSVWRLTKNGD
ncbi:MAG: EamA family transporter [Rhodospirillales bacterium]|nr:EamA family transporter [Rhodospirillales bacterium]